MCKIEIVNYLTALQKLWLLERIAKTLLFDKSVTLIDFWLFSLNMIIYFFILRTC